MVQSQLPATEWNWQAADESVLYLENMKHKFCQKSYQAECPALFPTKDVFSLAHRAALHWGDPRAGAVPLAPGNGARGRGFSQKIVS